MERHELLEMMAQLKLAGMRTAYDEILANGLKRRHPVQEIIGTLLTRPIHGLFSFKPRLMARVSTRHRLAASS